MTILLLGAFVLNSATPPPIITGVSTLSYPIFEINALTSDYIVENLSCTNSQCLLYDYCISSFMVFFLIRCKFV